MINLHEAYCSLGKRARIGKMEGIFELSKFRGRTNHLLEFIEPIPNPRDDENLPVFRCQDACKPSALKCGDERLEHAQEPDTPRPPL